MAGKLKLYTDAFSPVCRAVMWLLESEGIPYEERTLLLRKGINARLKDMHVWLIRTHFRT